MKKRWFEELVRFLRKIGLKKEASFHDFAR